MKRIFFFPIQYKSDANKYTFYFVEALNKKYHIVNKNKKKSLFNILKSFLRSNIFIFNWTENFAFEKLGKYYKIPIYILSTLYLKIFKKKIIWIFHNKYSHSGYNYLSYFLLKYNACISNLIITHSKEGVSYCKKHYHKNSNIIFLPHPIYPDAKLLSYEEKYDIIIWGKILKYKNILDFLIFWNTTKEAKYKRILICGKCDDIDYDSLIKKQTEINSNIEYRNEYISDENLNIYISMSKCILFTYASNSVLSSGALNYSLSFKKKIIGPNKGAFNDLSELGIIYTYKEYREINELLLKDYINNNEILEQYLTDNSWDNFVSNFDNYLNFYNI